MGFMNFGRKGLKGLLSMDPAEGMQVAQDAPKPMSFWQGGDKFSGRDAIAGLLSVLGDAIATQSGGEGGGVSALGGMRAKAMADAAKRRDEAAQLQRIYEAAQRQGMTTDNVDLQLAGIKMPEAEKPPAIGQNLDYFREHIQNDPQALSAFEQYQSLVNPRYMIGADGLPYQTNGYERPVGKITRLGGPQARPAGGFR